MSRQMQTMDGNQAAAHVSFAYTEVAAIYPITPSSPMAELVDDWNGKGRKNILDNSLVISEMQSEAGAAGAVHGALIAGSLATTYTASQGLLLMLPNIYRMAGELLPGVIHVAARTIATHALSIFGDHSDIYACRQTGAAIWATGSVQEVMDLSPVAHLSALEGRLPFLHFFDGFRTSHELHKIEVWDYADLKDMFNPNALEVFRKHALHPAHNRIMGSAQNPDIFFQAREAANPYYDALPQIVENNIAKINEKLGTNYGLFDYYGAPDASHVIIAMGSVCETIKEYIDYANDSIGLVSVHLYRPFSAAHLLKAIPASVRQITVLDRTKEPGSIGEPLFLDVLAALQDSPFANIPVYSGRYGLSSKDTTPAQIAAVYANHSKKRFTVGIEDDVTRLSLPVQPLGNTAPEGNISCKFWGLGGDGTISATKNAIKIIGDNSPLYAQGYFEYDSKKSRGLTISHLRFGKQPIRSTYVIQHADFVACHNPAYLHKYNMIKDLKDGGIFLINCYYKEKDLEDYLPDAYKAYIAQHNIRLYLIDAIRIGKEIGLNNKISTILQAAFFSVTDILPKEEARQLMKTAAKKSYGKSGEKIIQMNYDAIDRGMSDVIEVTIPSHWAQLNGSGVEDAEENKFIPCAPELMDYVKNVQFPIVSLDGDTLPVSAFSPYADGAFPAGSSAHERRNVTTEIPVWKPENCIQCNRCSYVCPHAVVRPAVLTKEELANAPDNMESLDMLGMPEHHFAITISNVDCTGCGSCVAICPGKQGKKALDMVPIHEHTEQQQYFDYCTSLPFKKEAAEKFKTSTVKGSQFLRPLMEFSGACAGCGETPYVKLLTQLFGPRMYIANATGCSSIWANSSPTCAYCRDGEGYGPAWSNSLFEDAAEFGYGMLMAKTAHQLRIAKSQANCSPAVANASTENCLSTSTATTADEDSISHLQDLPNMDTIPWIIGGDGWAYDIGFSGLDHVISTGKNINILVLDTEVYSNTGGQASKSTPLGATAKFVNGGKTTRKKDLASIAMTYGDVYVAQIAMGADLNQTIKAITEAAAYPGPSLVIAYATCIAHGIVAGLGSTPHEEAKAVETGYFHLFRYNPLLREQNKNPFVLDSKEPNYDLESFLSGEQRYQILQRFYPEEAKKMFQEVTKQAKLRYQYLAKLCTLHEPDSIE